MEQTFYSIHDYYISHHGIKGQKWGVRRFQNPDGTLTAEGRKRYGQLTDSKAPRNKMLVDRTSGKDIDVKKGSGITRVTYWGPNANAATRWGSRRLEKQDRDKFMSIEGTPAQRKDRPSGADFYTDIFTRSGKTANKAEITRYQALKDLKIAGGDTVWDIVNKKYGNNWASGAYTTSKAVQYGYDSLLPVTSHVNKAVEDMANNMKIKDAIAESKKTKPLSRNVLEHVIENTKTAESEDDYTHKTQEATYFKNRQTYVANVIRSVANTTVNNVVVRSDVKHLLNGKYDGMVDINDPDAYGSIILFDPKTKVSEIEKISAKKYLKNNPSAKGAGSGNFGRKFWS